MDLVYAAEKFCRSLVPPDVSVADEKLVESRRCNSLRSSRRSE
jgi:hypothetical protein